MTGQPTAATMLDVEGALSVLRRDVTGTQETGPVRAAIAVKRAEAERLHAEADRDEALADLAERLNTRRVALDMAVTTMRERLTLVGPAEAALADADADVADLRQQLADLRAVETPSRDIRAMAMIVAEDLADAEARRRPVADQMAAATRDFNAAGAEAKRIEAQVVEAERLMLEPLAVYDIPAALTRAVRTHWITLLTAKAGGTVDAQELALATLTAHAMYAAAGLSAQAKAAVEGDNDRRDGHPNRNKGARP